MRRLAGMIVTRRLVLSRAISELLAWVGEDWK